MVAGIEQPASKAGVHTIRVVARMTGISPHTLRMWERRYGFPAPMRTEGGARRYRDADVEKLRLIARALELGYRPGNVVPRSISELAKLVESTDIETRAAVPDVDQLLAALAGSDETHLHELLQRAVAAHGLLGFVTEVVGPVCVRVGELWAEGTLSVHHEHLLSEVLTTRMRVLLSAYEERQGRPRVLLCALPDELHALGVQMAALYLALGGAKPRLLGVNTPVAEIAAAANAFDADVVGVSLPLGYDVTRARRLLRELVGALPRRIELWLGGAAAAEIADAPIDAHRVDDWKDLDEALASWRRRQR